MPVCPTNHVANGILYSIKKLAGLDEENIDFDIDILVHINMAFATLNQLNVGPLNGFSISGYEEKWNDFMSPGPILDMVKTYIASKVRLVFDPPTVGCVMDALKKTIDELEWRLRVGSDV